MSKASAAPYPPLPQSLALRDDAQRACTRSAVDQPVAETPALPPTVPSWPPEQLTERQTIRRFRPEPVSIGMAERLIDAAASAPSAHNRQPWRFCLVWNDARRQVLADRMGARLRAERERDADAPLAISADVQRSRARIVEAPLVVVVSMTMAEMDRYPDPRRSRAEHHMAVQSTAMAGQNLLLAAHALGLGACWMCAPLFCPDEVRTALDLPADWEPQGLVLVGHPAEGGRNKPRKPRESIAVSR